MIHSKIFSVVAVLGLTGATAFAASKANHRSVVYYQTMGGRFAPITLIGICPIGNPTCQEVVWERGVPTVRQLYSSASLAHPLDRQPF